MRVVHVITRMILGGAQENTLLSVVGLNALPDCEALLVTGPTVGPEGSLVEAARAAGVEPIIIPSLQRELSLTRDPAAYLALRRELKRLAPDVVHTHSSKAGFLGRLAARAAGVPVVVHTIHGPPFHPYEKPWRNRLFRFAERLAARRTDRLVVVAEAMRETFLAAGVGRPEQFVTIRSGLDVDAFLAAAAERAAARRRFGFGETDLVVGKVARLFELKGHADVLAAAARVFPDEPRARLLFIGDGILRGALEREAARLGLAGRVVFAGLVPTAELPAALAATDLVVHASLREGLPRVVPQALLLARPVIVVDADGAREVVTDGLTGRLVPPHDPEALAAALRELLADPALRERLGAAGRERVREEFRKERMVERLHRLYRELLAVKVP